MDKKPLVSIITICYNSEKYIKDTIESILSQKYNRIEYILIDGNSTDGTLDIIKKYEDKFNGRLKWISETDDGIYNAMNKGISMSEGELIGIINSDDYLNNDKVINQVVNVFMKNSESVIVGNVQMISKNKENLFFKKNNQNISSIINYTMPINHPSTFVPRRIYEKFGFFNEKYEICGDYELVYRWFHKDVKFVFLDKILVNMRTGGISTKLFNLFLITKEHYMIRKDFLNIFSNLYFTSSYFLKKLIKLLIKKLISTDALNNYYKNK